MSRSEVYLPSVNLSEDQKQQPRRSPDQVEKQHQAVGDPLARPHDEDIEVNSDGHGPEERAGVGEGGYRALDHAVHRVGAENSPHSVRVRERRQPVGDGEVEQQRARGRAQVCPQDVGEDDEGRAEEGESAGAQHNHLLGQVHDRLVPAGHGDSGTHCALMETSASTAAKHRLVRKSSRAPLRTWPNCL